jgi:hypothetical protein
MACSSSASLSSQGSSGVHIPTSPVMFGSTIRQLGLPYVGTEGSFQYSDNPLMTPLTNDEINFNGFMGSSDSVFISPKYEITYDAFGCLASPRITLLAQHRIRLGTYDLLNSQTAASLPAVINPLRIYVPDTLLIRTGHLVLGDIAFLGHAFPLVTTIACDKLTILRKTHGVNPSYYQFIISNLTGVPQIEILDPILPALPLQVAPLPPYEDPRESSK